MRERTHRRSAPATPNPHSRSRGRSRGRGSDGASGMVVIENADRPMTDHLRRIREHMGLETKALLLEAEQARLFDHSTNRGSEAEHSILRWLRARYAPGYTVSSGEIIDSFDTNIDLKSRQQDGILHRDDPDANRFLLPSGMRLVPVETAAAVVEVKLTLSKEEFEKSDMAATETARLRLRGQPHSMIGTASGVANVNLTSLISPEQEHGIALDHPQLALARPSFAIFAFGGVREVETIASWLRDAQNDRPRLLPGGRVCPAGPTNDVGTGALVAESGRECPRALCPVLEERYRPPRVAAPVIPPRLLSLRDRRCP